MGHMSKTYFLTLQKTPRFMKKPEGEGRGQNAAPCPRACCRYIYRTSRMDMGRGSRSVVCGCYESYNCKGGCCGLLARSWLQVWRIPGFKPDSTVWGPLRAKSHVVVKRHPVGVIRELAERIASSGVVLVI
ncbi:hypothetical protein AVEN_257539-1 [Araneus ventricosus]|uniref:Uncharacterized protein n=1 Tax=Araneus ventricosus TaxID=182803 RepID=A0A4Y2UJ93_ARAVE|nr:hypothetical protein AVEN_257539-1 [Araneus ventricosus]